MWPRAWASPGVFREPGLTSPVVTAGCNSEDSLCEPSLELEFTNHRQCGEWSVRVPFSLGPRTCFRTQYFSFELNPVWRSSTQTRKRGVFMLKWEWGVQGSSPRFPCPPQRPERAASASVTPGVGMSPPIKHPPPGGLDFPSEDVLVARHMGGITCSKVFEGVHLNFGCPQELQVAFHLRSC